MSEANGFSRTVSIEWAFQNPQKLSSKLVSDRSPNNNDPVWLKVVISANLFFLYDVAHWPFVVPVLPPTRRRYIIVHACLA
jgi:hypothetical protein